MQVVLSCPPDVELSGDVVSSRLVRDDVGLLFVVRWRVGIVGLGRRGLATRRGSRELDGDLARRFRGRVRLDLINAALGEQGGDDAHRQTDGKDEGDQYGERRFAARSRRVLAAVLRRAE